MEDIEDIVASADDLRSEVARPAPLLATSRVRIASGLQGAGTGGGAQTSGCGGAEGDADSEAKVGVPGTERVWVKTYGCSHNISDSEYMAGALDSYGYELVSDRLDAELWLINSCTVKDPSESAFLNLVREGKVGTDAAGLNGVAMSGTRARLRACVRMCLSFSPQLILTFSILGGTCILRNVLVWNPLAGSWEACCRCRLCDAG